MYTKHQHRVLAFIYTLVPNRADAEDLFQDTSILLWKKFDQFEPGTDFIARACRVAFLKVSNHRKRFARSNVFASDALLQAVADRAVQLAAQLDGRREALRECLKRLDERDRRMIAARYEPGGGAERAAGVSGRTLQATYKALYRIRKALFITGRSMFLSASQGKWIWCPALSEIGRPVRATAPQTHISNAHTWPGISEAGRPTQQHHEGRKPLINNAHQYDRHVSTKVKQCR